MQGLMPKITAWDVFVARV